GTEGTNNTTFEPDGTMVFNGDATVWDDIMVFPDGTGKGGSNPPTWTKFLDNGFGSQGVFLWMFSATAENEVYFTVQIPHSYKVGTAIYPHVHWTTTTATPSGTNVVWGLEYSWAVISGSYPNTSTLTANTLIPGQTPSDTHQHLITPLGTVTGSMGISTVLCCRLYRAATNAGDTFNGTVGLLGVDFHFQKDTEGSRSEYQK
ncbi:MAG TPA: hypothetical protein PKG48_11190, partial [Bacteroidales bacterium]|nr:hypothetical protein [Bacteroidales bacterium]